MNLRALLNLSILALGCLAPLAAGGSQEPSAQAAAAPAADKPVYAQDFEGDLGGWTGRSSAETLSLKGLPAHGGAQALTVSRRTATWNGPMRDMTNVFKNGRTYRIQFWARFDDGPENMSLNVSFQKAVDGQGDVYETIGSDMMIRGEWIKVDIEYTVPKDKAVTARKLYFETPWKPNESLKHTDLVTFAIDDLTITRIADAAPMKVRKDIPAFSTLFPAGMKIGTAIVSDHMNPENIHHDLLRHFNTLVYGNEMKQDAIQPKEGAFVFGKADALVKYAQATGVKLRGHTLVWHQQYPSWLFKDPEDGTKMASKDLLLKRLETHIKTLVGRYKGQFDSWDVVNEAIAEDGTLRDSPYLKIVGSDEYIEKAFRWAHEADPAAKLVLNDYNTEYGGAKQDGFYKEVKSLLDRGVPVTAVGFQTHIAINRPQVNDIRDAIRKFAALGLEVQITELDVSIYGDYSENKKKITRDILMDQAARYSALFKMFREEYEAGRLSTVLIWGMSDDETWLDNHPKTGRTDYPLLFGKDLQPKPAYWTVVDPAKLPVFVQKTDALRAESAPAPDADVWNTVSPKAIADRKGVSHGWFKVLWTPEGLHLLARVLDKTVDPSDALTLYLDPKNAKTPALPADALKVVLGRDRALDSDADGYRLAATVPFPTPAKTMMSVGFDATVTDGSTVSAWNDWSLTQAASAENYGTLALKPMPPVAQVRKGTPKVDGTVDPLWAEVPALPLTVETQGNADEGSTVKLLWDEGHLYALFEIKDKVLNDKAASAWEQDTVEAFLDQNNAKTKVYEADDGQYRVSFRNAPTFNGGQTEGFASASRVFAGGYRVEMALPLYAVTGAPDLLVGFDAQVNNADASASRAGIRNWVDSSNNGYRDTSAWGVLRLVP